MLVHEILKIKEHALFTATPGQSLTSAIAVMAEGDVGSLVVMDVVRMDGMLTVREVRHALRQRACQVVGMTVSSVMVKNPATCLLYTSRCV